MFNLDQKQMVIADLEKRLTWIGGLERNFVSAYKTIKTCFKDLKSK